VLEKRFNLSWSIEGTRSRTGKMLPPRLGLLAYAADAYLQGRVDDIALLPVSITCDQLHEISEYAAYARGAAKKPEGFGWLYGFIRAQGARHYGKVYVRFGEPVLLSSFLGPAGDAAAEPGARRLALQKTAFEVAWRINQGMPVTATAIVTTVLLAMQGAALTFGQIRLGLGDALRIWRAVRYLGRRQRERCRVRRRCGRRWTRWCRVAWSRWCGTDASRSG